MRRPRRREHRTEAIKLAPRPFIQRATHDNPMMRDRPADMGVCCSCGKEDATVRNALMLPHPAPVPGTGWGCALCKLGANGAVAIVCDACLKAASPKSPELQLVVSGYPADKGRIPMFELSQEHFGHDLSKHLDAGRGPHPTAEERR